MEFEGRTVGDLLEKCEALFNTSVSVHYYELELPDDCILKDGIELRLKSNIVKDESAPDDFTKQVMATEPIKSTDKSFRTQQPPVAH